MSRSSFVVGGVIVLGVAGWMASGMLGDEAAPATAADPAAPAPPLVEVRLSEAAPITRHIVVQGDVRAFRQATAKAETAGLVAEILVDVGQRVEAGEPVARLTLEGRDSRLDEARAVLEQRQADYDNIASLAEKGFATTARVRELRTELERARADLAELEEQIGNTTVGAPFAGVINSLAVEEGEFVSVNADIATLIDNSPLRVDVRVNQQDIPRIPADGTADVAFATGSAEGGRICFVSAAADAETRTFRVEIRTPNAENTVPSGISAEVAIPTGEESAHFVSPAILSLGTDGTLGIKTASEDGEVGFTPIEVVRAQTDGVWVSGLPGTARIITVGQGFVQAGDTVRVAMAEAEDDAADGAAETARAGAAGALRYPSTAICEREPDLALEEFGPVAAADRAGVAIADADPDSANDSSEVADPDADRVADVPATRRLQRALNALGYDAGPEDGVMGAKTREALEAYRRANDLGGDEPAAAHAIETAGLGGQQGATQ